MKYFTTFEIVRINKKENDFVKFGKQLQVATTKLIKVGVLDPVVAGLFVEGVHAEIYAMDLAYNGIYRMMNIGRFDFPRNKCNDLLLVPVCMENMFLIFDIVCKTRQKLYSALEANNKKHTKSFYQEIV